MNVDLIKQLIKANLNAFNQFAIFMFNTLLRIGNSFVKTRQADINLCS